MSRVDFKSGHIALDTSGSRRDQRERCSSLPKYAPSSGPVQTIRTSQKVIEHIKGNVTKVRPDDPAG